MSRREADERARAFGSAMADNLRRNVGDLRRSGAVMSVSSDDLAVRYSQEAIRYRKRCERYEEIIDVLRAELSKARTSNTTMVRV